MYEAEVCANKHETFHRQISPLRDRTRLPPCPGRTSRFRRFHPEFCRLQISPPNLRQTCRVKILRVLKSEFRVFRLTTREQSTAWRRDLQKPCICSCSLSATRKHSTSKEVRLKNYFMHDAGFHLDLESNNADCGDLIDLMKPEREPSTIFFGNVTCQGQRF